MLVLGGNGHKLNASLIDYETDLEYQVDLGSRIRMPVWGGKPILIKTILLNDILHRLDLVLKNLFVNIA